MIPPWNHDYYYVFALVPLSVLFLDSIATANRGMLAGTLIAYVLMSPPIPYGIVDRLHVLPIPFAYAVNYYNLPVFGGIVLWILATHQWLNETRESTASARAIQWRAIAAATIASALVLGAVAALWRLRAPEVVRLSTADLTFTPPIDLTDASALALTRDGSRLAYVAIVKQERVLCIRGFDDRRAQCLPGTERGGAPFFSPDGQWLGFFADGELRKIPVRGGPVQTITKTDRPDAGSWFDDDSVVFASSAGISRVSASGGSPELLISTEGTGGEFRWPTVTSDGRAILFTEVSTAKSVSAGTIIAWSFRTRSLTWLMPGVQPHIDRDDGVLIYSAGGQIVAARFDEQRLEITSAAVPVAPRAILSTSGVAQVAVASNGTLVYAPQGPQPAVRRTLAWVDRTGAVTPLAIAPAAFEMPRLSPDGSHLAVVIREATTDVWVYDLATGASSRATTSSLTNTTPAWRPHAGNLWFVTDTPDRSFVSAMPLERLRSEDRPVWKGAGPVRLASWSPDGRLLAGTRNGDLWILRPPNEPVDAVVATDGLPPAQPTALVFQTQFEEKNPSFSPDGRWLAYSADVPGWDQVYIRSAEGLGEPVRVSEGASGGGFQPHWSPSGRELFYRTNNYMMAVDVTEGPGATVRVGPPRPVFRNQYVTGSGETNYDLSPDGARFLMIVPPASYPQDVRVVRGWAASLPQ
jgi:serine/threonine-protein kinase